MTTRFHKPLIIAALCLSVAATAFADDSNLYRGGFQFNSVGATPRNDDSLYKDLGGKDQIEAFTKDFVGLISRDERIGKFFVNVNLDRLAGQLTDQFIDLAGGPAKYSGRDMKEVHASLGLTNADFNRLAEDLQIAMEQHNVPFATQNRLVALLASMQRVVVTK